MKRFVYLMMAIALPQTTQAAPLTVTVARQPLLWGWSGGTVTLSASASGGTQPYYYQWKFFNNYNTEKFHFSLPGFPGTLYYPPPYSGQELNNLPGGTPTIITVAGQYDNDMSQGDVGDYSLAINASLDHPTGVAVDANGNLFIADYLDNVIREKTSWDGKIYTIAGNYANSVAGETYNGPGSIFDDTPATAIDLGLSSTANGDFGASVFVFNENHNVFVTDTGNNLIRIMEPSSRSRATGIPEYAMQTFAGTGNGGGPDLSEMPTYNPGPVGVTATGADLNYPAGITVDKDYNIYIADSTFNVVRVIPLPYSQMEIFAGTGPESYTGLPTQWSGGGSPASVPIGVPAGVAVDSANNVYITDYQDGYILKVTGGINGQINAIAGNSDGTPDSQVSFPVSATSIDLNGPVGVAADANGNVYYAEPLNNRVYVVANGTVNVFAGNGAACNQTQVGSGDGNPAVNAELNGPTGVAVDGNGNVFIADTGDDVIREVVNSQNANYIINNLSASDVGYYQVVVTDSAGDTNSSAIIPVSMVYSPTYPFIRIDDPPQTFNLNILSRPDYTNILLYTTSLTPPIVWKPLATNVVGDNDNWAYVETNTTSPQRYYRLSEAAVSNYIGNSLTVTNSAGADGLPPLVILGEYDSRFPLSESSAGSLPVGQVQDVKFYGQNYNFTLYALAWVTNGPNTNEQTFQVVDSQSFTNSAPTIAGVQILTLTNFFVNGGNILAFAGTGPYYLQPPGSNELDAVYANASNPGSYTATRPRGPGATFTVGLNGDGNATYNYIPSNFTLPSRTYAIGVDVLSP